MPSPPETLEHDLTKLGAAAVVDRVVAAKDTDVLDHYLELAARRINSNVEVAEAALEVSKELADRLDRRDILPQVRYLQARLAVNGGRPEEALNLIDEAKAGWLAVGRPIDAYRTDLGRMHVLDDLGRHADATATGENLVTSLDRLLLDRRSEDRCDGWDTTTQISWLRAAAGENLGAAYGYTGQHEKALAAYKAAEKNYQAVGDTGDVARCRANRGVELVAIGQAGVGLAAISEAAQMFADIDDRHSYAKSLAHWAEAELLLGRYADCLTRFAEARRNLEELDARAEAARLAVKTMRAYLALNLDDEAEGIGHEAETALAEAGLLHDLAEVRWLLAATHVRNQRPDRALFKLDEAIVGATASDDLPLKARILVTRSQALSDLRRADEALLAAREALDILSDGHWPVEEWNAHIRFSHVVSGRDRLHHLDMARALAKQLCLPHLQYVVLLELGRYQRAIGDDVAAHRSFENAVEVVEGLRGLILDEALRTSFLEGRTAAYSELIAIVLTGSNRQDKLRAFDLAEASKARTLADMMAATDQRRVPPTAGTVRAGGEQADLDACYSALVTSGAGLTRSRREAIQQRAIELETALSRSQLEGGSHPTIPLDQAGAAPATPQPRRDEQVVEYHVIDDTVVAFVWTGGELALVTDLPTLAETNRLLNDWERQRQRFRIATQTGSGGHEALVTRANAALAAIWARLFSPVAESLAEGGRLLIIPHGPTYAIPFHALPGPERRVGQTWTVGLAPSYLIASRLHSRGRGESTPAKGSLVIGVADEAAPAVTDESTVVAGLLTDADLLLDSAATVDAVKSDLEVPRDVIHLACHGLHRARNPMFSALKLFDGWLTAHDVLNLKLADSLVVLSACESGRHSHQRHLSEPVGLARSFLAAGARAVVVSMWLADDRATAELMTGFYRRVKLGSSPAEALQLAQAVVEETNPHPAVWAPFVIHGDSSRGDN